MLKDEFKKLQLEWYDLLARSGFKDIEKFKGDELILISPTHVFHNHDYFYILERTEYFRKLGLAVNGRKAKKFPFKDETEKFIVTSFSEGRSVKEIAETLKERGTPKHRHSIRFIIRRYEVLWDIREYEPEELNLKRFHG